MDFLHQKYELFQNPNKLPLNELSISIVNVKPQKTPPDDKLKGTPETYPAIHEVFIDEYPFIEYQPYDERAQNQENMIKIYLKKGRTYVGQLKYLLSCNYHQFWCYILRAPNTVKMLHSFLYNFSPLYEWHTMDKDCFKLFFSIYKQVATILIRLFTFEHSPIEYMDPITTIQLLEQARFLTFPIAVNICILYAEHYPVIVKETAELYFALATPHSWHEDFNVMLDKVLVVFRMWSALIRGYMRSSDLPLINVPIKPSVFEPSWYEDVLKYYLDTIRSLSSILMVSKYAMHQSLAAGIPKCLTMFYNEFFPIIFDIMSFKRTLPYDWSSLQTRILDRIALARLDSIDCFNAFSLHLIDAIFTNSENRELHVEEYMKLITNAMEDELFFFDYHSTHAIDSQIAIITTCCPQLDETRTSFILNCLRSLPKVDELIAKSADKTNKTLQQEEPETAASTSAGLANNEVASTTVPIPSEDDINERINVVIDTMPDLGDGFVLRCLEFYQYDPIEVLHAILDQNLPPVLQGIPPGLIRQPPEPEPEKPILAYRGKKPQKEDATALLNDKSDLPRMKDFILNAAMVSDDDYDDREEINSASIRRQPGNGDDDPYEYMVNRFDADPIASESSDYESDAKEKAQESGPRKDLRAFCEDPAKLREQREMARKNFRKQRDVVGKPKGQGQDKKVLENRHKKDVNKATRANHNRKGGAQWKRSAGMI